MTNLPGTRRAEVWPSGNCGYLRSAGCPRFASVFWTLTWGQKDPRRSTRRLQRTITRRPLRFDLSHTPASAGLPYLILGIEDGMLRLLCWPREKSLSRYLPNFWRKHKRPAELASPRRFVPDCSRSEE